VESGDTLASLARRYGALVSAVSAANRGELPEAGLLAAIPVAYAGDRVTKASARSSGSAAKSSAATLPAVKSAAGPPTKPVTGPAARPPAAKVPAAKFTAGKPAAKQNSRKPGPALAHKLPSKAPGKRSRA